MANYRDTLNLPRTDFPMKADLPRREPERIAWWDARELDRKRWTFRRGRPVLLLHDGPPYSNDHIHLGTAANKVWKDALVRSASLLGFDSPYLPGWDNHGLPIEVRVARERRDRGEADDQLALRRRCRAFAAEWVEVQKREFIRLGVGGPWDRPYLTMDPGFEAAILDALAALVERGFVQRGLRSIHWCPTDRTALAEAEIEHREMSSPSIHVAFPLAEDPKDVLGGPVEAVAWTTTPWTLPANLGLMVDPKAEYVVVRPAGAERGASRRFLVAAARLPAVAEALGWSAPVVERRIRGEDLLGLVFVNPWERPARVVDGTPFVSLEDGTGLVHTAPGHGKEDFAVGARSGLGVLNPVDEAGRFTDGAEPFVGRSVLEVDDDIIAWLRRKERLLGASRLVHSYPHCWRCRQPVIFRATKQWFMMIDHQGHRERALGAIEGAVRWEPEGSRNRIRDAVRLRPDWCLSRQRSWGVGIPAIYCEACGEATLDRRVIAAAAHLTREHGSDVWYELPVERFTPPDLSCPACGAAGPFRKEKDILDVWFDSGSSHRAVAATHPALAAVWQRALAENGRVVYLEGPDQHRGWFNSSLMVGVGITGRPPFTDVLTHGWVLDSDGRAMHKSIGNVISPEDVIRRYGADIVRWWALSADWRVDVRIGEEILQRVSDAYRKIRNTFRFLLGNLHDFSPHQALEESSLTRLDRAFDAHLRLRVDRLREDYGRFLFHRVSDALLDACTVDLSSLFLDAAKDRLYTLRPDDPARRSAQTVLWRALHDLTIAASPLLAFTAEEVWQSHPDLVREAESVHLASWPASGPRDTERAEDWRLLLEARAAANAAIEPLRIQKKLATTLAAEVLVTLPQRTAERLQPYRDELAGFLLVARAELRADPASDAPSATARETDLPRCDRCWTHREDVRADSTGSSLCSRCTRALEGGGVMGRRT